MTIVPVDVKTRAVALLAANTFQRERKRPEADVNHWRSDAVETRGERTLVFLTLGAWVVKTRSTSGVSDGRVDDKAELIFNDKSAC